MPEQPILLVCNKHDDTMSFVDLTSYEVLETIPTGPNPHEIVVTPDNRWAYLSNYAPPGNTISLIDLVAAKHVRQISTGEYSRIHGAAMAPDGRWAYFTAGQKGYVVELDTRTNEVTRAILTCGKISHMVLVSPEGDFLYTANIVTKDVSVLRRTDGALAALVPCQEGVEGLGITPDGRELWALNQESGTITVISRPSHKVAETFPCPGMPVRVAFALDGQLALVPSWTEHGELIAIETAIRREV
ncbi:MAG TPA: YncE family protein, partial [Candidatus Latescibacteria bacterium]|nr:YncE family protein [Candidatus Latescibacterota bacterium]